SRQAKEGQDRQDDDDQPYEVDDRMHGISPRFSASNSQLRSSVPEATTRGAGCFQGVSRHTPASQGELAFAVFAISDDRGGIVGKMPGSGGRLPVLSRIARASSRMATWPLVIEYRLHMASLRSAASAGRQATRWGEIDRPDSRWRGLGTSRQTACQKRAGI